VSRSNAGYREVRVGVIDRAEGEHANAAARFDTSIRLFESIGQRRGIAVGSRERGIFSWRKAGARRPGGISGRRWPMGAANLIHLV
jgi:hypothetical protein